MTTGEREPSTRPPCSGSSAEEGPRPRLVHRSSVSTSSDCVTPVIQLFEYPEGTPVSWDLEGARQALNARFLIEDGKHTLVLSQASVYELQDGTRAPTTLTFDHDKAELVFTNWPLVLRLQNVIEVGPWIEDSALIVADSPAGAIYLKLSSDGYFSMTGRADADEVRPAVCTRNSVSALAPPPSRSREMGKNPHASPGSQDASS